MGALKKGGLEPSYEQRHVEQWSMTRYEVSLKDTTKTTSHQNGHTFFWYT